MAAFAVWRWTTSLRKSAAIATLTAGTLCTAVAVHDMLDIRAIFGGSSVLVWIDGVGWGLGLVFLSGVALALLSVPLLKRGRAAKRPGLNWKQSALLAGIAAMFLVGLSNVASSEPDRAGSGSLLLEGPGSQLKARDVDEEIVYGHSLRRDVGLWYGEWRLDFDGEELAGRYR